MISLRRTTPLLALASLVSCLFAAAPVSAQALSPTEAAAVDGVVAKALAATGTPSASVAIVRGGRIVFTKAYGKQSDALPIARTDVKYPIASISKQFTAAALLLLQEEGKLSLDDKVAKYLPEVTGADTISVRQLLSHTAGLRDYWPQDYGFAAMEKPTTPQGIIDRWAKSPLDFAPGTKWQYSNTGYVVAGQIAEKAAGKPLMAYLQDKVFAPLGIAPVDQDKAIGKGFPSPYHRYALGPVRVEKAAAPGWLYAAGELAMTPAELAAWDIARLDRRILAPEAWAAQETPVKLADGSDTGYGLGVGIATTDGRKMIEHSGEAVGFLSENIVYPDQKAAIVVLTNSDFGNAFTSIAQGIAKVVLPASGPQEDTKTAAARALFASLKGGTLDRAQLTDDANYYFTPTALADYRASLSALGEPRSFEATGKPRLRGGFVNRNYKVVYPNRTLNVVTYAEPGETGRYEQFIVMPAN